MNSKKDIYARSGLFAKALLFLSIGVITALEAFGLGGFKAGSFTVMHVLAEHSYGKAILILWALGLFGYVFWRVYETIVDNEGYGNGIIGIGQRIGFCFGGLVYAFLAFSALQVAINSGGSSWLANSDFQKLIHSKAGKFAVIGVAFGMMGATLNEFYIAFSRIFKKTINIEKVAPKYQKLYVSFGTIGYASRGITVGVAAFLLLDSAYTTRDISNADKEAAFSVVEYLFGNFTLGVIAIGFIIYSCYVFVEVRYRKINM